MTNLDEITQYPFPLTPEENDYRIFPNNIENHEFIFFHGTAEKNLASILKEGFRIQGHLPSVSFARNSDLALKYACEARSETSPSGVVLAIQYDDLDGVRLVQESFGLHVYDMSIQPKIIGYCIVPVTYQYR